MISFSWNNPPHMPAIRWQYTSVVVRLEKISEAKTKVMLSQSGFGDGKDWDETIFNVLKRVNGTIRHFWGSEMSFAPPAPKQHHRAGVGEGVVLRGGYRLLAHGQSPLAVGHRQFPRLDAPGDARCAEAPCGRPET